METHIKITECVVVRTCVCVCVLCVCACVYVCECVYFWIMCEWMDGGSGREVCEKYGTNAIA